MRLNNDAAPAASFPIPWGLTMDHLFNTLARAIRHAASNAAEHAQAGRPLMTLWFLMEIVASCAVNGVLFAVLTLVHFDEVMDLILAGISAQGRMFAALSAFIALVAALGTMR